MVLLVDKYRPQTLEKLDLHDEITQQLSKILAHGDFPHLMFYGPGGGGKHTRIWAVLKHVFGVSTQKAKVQHKSFKVKSKLIEITCRVSNYHIEMNPSDVGLNDRHVIQEVIKEIAQTHNVGQAKTFKVVVLNEVDRLSKSAQHALRRTMERYTSTCRLIMCCESACRVIAPLRSRCLQIRVPLPTEEQVSGVLNMIATKEGFKLPVELSARIATESSRNLRRAILMLEACHSAHPQLTGDQKIALADWAKFVDHIAKIVCEEQSPDRLRLVRGKLYELLSNCVPSEIIIKTLTESLLRRVDDNIKHQIAQLAAEYEHRMQQGTKPIFHLEAFVAKFMAVYKRWVVETLM